LERLKTSIEEKKWGNIEKYLENQLHIKIKNKWEKKVEKVSGFEPITLRS
jgi:hypothetical protein